MKEFIMWCTYHEDIQIEQYNLRQNDAFRLFKGNALDVEGENINHLNAFYSEISTIYWVWKNNVRSEKVGFCHYRRNFLLYFIGIHKFFRRFHLTLPSAYAIISNCAGFAREICYAMTGGEHLCPESWLPEIEWWG